jgi:hypothetical protein
VSWPPPRRALRHSRSSSRSPVIRPGCTPATRRRCR